MKYGLLTLLLSVLFSLTTQAQSRIYRNSVQATLDYMSLDAPDDLGVRYGMRLARHFGNDRVVVAGSLGYLRKERPREAPNDAPLGIDRRKRLTADLTILVDFLKSRRHALRIGGGPSAWYRYDDLLMSYTIRTLPNGSVITTVSQREQLTALNMGYHLAGEYEFLLTSQVSVGGRINWADLNIAGISSIAGISIGYRF